MVTVPSTVLGHGEYGELPTLSFTYNLPEASPNISDLTETGYVLTITGDTFGSSGMVTLGSASNPNTNFECTTSSWTATSITCTRPMLPSGGWQVRVFSNDLGWSNPAPTLVWVDLQVSSVESNGINVSATSASEPWVLVMKISDGGVLGYDSPLWGNAELLNANSPEDQPGNAKYSSYNTVSFKRLRACVGSAHGQCIYYSFPTTYSSAQALFSAGYVRDYTVDQAGLVQALGATPGTYRACPMLFPGFNLDCGSNNKARWGFCANCPSQTCKLESEDSDAAVGIGLTGQSSDPVGAGWTAFFASGGGTCSATSTTHRDVWLYVENTAVSNGGIAGTLYSGYGAAAAAVFSSKRQLDRRFHVISTPFGEVAA